MQAIYFNLAFSREVVELKSHAINVLYVFKIYFFYQIFEFLFAFCTLNVAKPT